MKKLSLLVLSLISTFFLTAQTPGTLDLSFGDNGVKTIDFGGSINRCFAADIQPDQKFVLGGYSYNSTADISFSRVNPDGSLDVGFGSGGIVTHVFGGSEDYIYDLLVQPDGNILAVGYTCTGGDCSMIIVRLTMIGLFDPTFSSDGIVVVDFGPGVESYAESVTIQDDGKIIAAGQVRDLNGDSQCALCRLNPDGSMDNSFGTNGVLIMNLLSYENYINNVAMQGDHIIVGGVSYGDDYDYLTIARFDPSGVLDASFGVNGIVSIEVDLDPVVLSSRGTMCLDAEGRILYGLYMAGMISVDIAVYRFLENGPPDNSFGAYGLVVTPLEENSFTSYITVQYDGKILVGGESETNFTLLRYLENGDLDPSFGPNSNGIVYNYDLFAVRSLKIQDDGLILAASDAYIEGGSRDFAAARYYSGLNVGIESIQDTDISLNIHPNPFVDQLNINFSLTHHDRINIELIDPYGKTVAEIIDKSYSPGDYQIRWDGSRLSGGVYILKLSAGELIYTTKVLKQ